VEKVTQTDVVEDCRSKGYPQSTRLNCSPIGGCSSVVVWSITSNDATWLQRQAGVLSHQADAMRRGGIGVAHYTTPSVGHRLAG